MHYQTTQRIYDVIRNLKTFVYNLMYFAKRSQEDNDFAMLRNSILSLPGEVREKYHDECAYIESLPPEGLGYIMFPYPSIQHKDGNMSIFKTKGVSCALHDGLKQLYFPSRYAGTNYYCDLICREAVLGTGTLAKSPHCYQDKDFKVEEGDILLDVGCAEAIFALDNIEKVSKAYLFECAPEWRKPLKLTFAPYKDKVVIVNKLVSDKTTRKSTTLADIVKPEMGKGAHFFVKMDIEGWERTVINGNGDFFKSAKVKLSCCVYHRQDDATVIEKMLKDMGYKTRFSEGWMLPTMNGIHYPYFRHGVIYAQNY